MPPEPIELRGAYEWTCTECGKDQFVRGMALEASPEEIEELREDRGWTEASAAFSRRRIGDRTLKGPAAMAAQESKTAGP